MKISHDGIFLLNPNPDIQDLARRLRRADFPDSFLALEGQIDLAILPPALELLDNTNEIHPIIRLVERLRESGRLSTLADETVLMLECHYARSLLTALVPLRALCVVEDLMARAEPCLTGPALVDLHLLLSRCQFAAGQADAAIETLVCAESRWPHDSRVTFALMESLSKRDPDSALKILRRIEADPNMAQRLAQSIVLRVDILIGGGLVEEAMLRAVEATATEPDRLEALHAQINAFAAQGNTAGWAGAMDRYLKLGSRSELGLCSDRGDEFPAAFGHRDEPETLPVTPVSRLAVIMRVHNAASLLRRATASVLAQTYQAFRLILVDDSSTDTSGAIMREIAAADPRVVIIENPTTLGVFRSINRAMKLVCSDFYTFHDADAWMHPERLARAMAVIEAGTEVQCVYSQWIQIDRQGRVETPLLENLASTLFARSVRDDVGYFDQAEFGAEAEFQWRLRKRYGTASVITLPDIMTVGLGHFRSSAVQSGSAFDTSSANPIRSAYAEGFLRWHMSADAETSLRVACDDGPRPFPASREMPGLTPVNPAAIEDPFVTAQEVAEARDGSPLVVRWPDAPPGGRNWGDKLNPVLVALLSERAVINSQHPDCDRSAPVHYVVGSGIASAGDTALVWGSGFIASDQRLKAPVERIVAVRGPLTRQRVAEAGGDPALPLGDPALVLPLFYAPDIAPRYDIGVIQHFREAGTEPLPRFPSGISVCLIDITGGIKEVIDAVLSCRQILSSSIHGLIVSHAYGVPATWLKFSDRPLGDDFKFRDYWASIGHVGISPTDMRGGKIVDPAAGISTPGEVMVDLFALLGACPFISEERRLSLIEAARAPAREGTRRSILSWHAGHDREKVMDHRAPLTDQARQNRWCIFTSAGDYSNLAQWRPAPEEAGWDLITAFYGDSEEEYSALSRISATCLRLKGSKFQNLKHIYDTHPEIFAGYTHIWVCDDDIQMSPDQIIQAFTLSEQLGLWASQPAFSLSGKAPHRVTISQFPDCDLRLTTFIEVTCPLFRADKLFDFLSAYDPLLMGWGIDWWFCHHLRSSQNWRFAILDCIEVTNPLPAQRRGGFREILRLATNEQREAQWRAVQKARAIPEIEQRTLARLTLPTPAFKPRE